MTERITRREFLSIAASKCGPLFRLVYYSVVFIIIAWLAVGAFYGWRLLAFLGVGIALFATLRSVAVRLYGRLSVRGKAVCHAVREILDIMFFIAAGILAWHQLQSGDTGGSIVTSVLVLVAALDKARRAYKRQRAGELKRHKQT